MATILPATPADLTDVHTLIAELAEYEKLTHLCTGGVAELGEALFGPRPAAEVLVARQDGAIAGFALHFPTFSTFLARRGLWLEDLYVRPAHRGKGIGRALLAAVAQVAAARGCGRLEWSVLDWNAPALAFYRGMGATVMDDWRIARVTGEALASLASRGGAAPAAGAARRPAPVDRR